MEGTQPTRLQHLFSIMRQVILLLLIAFVGAIIWTSFDVWQVGQTMASNDVIIAESGIPTGAIAHIENTVVGRANVESGDYQLESIVHAADPSAILESAADAWCVIGRFSAADTTSRRLSLVLVGDNWSARSAENILVLWRDAGCIAEEASATTG